MPTADTTAAVVIPNPDAVNEYLKPYPELAALLPELSAHARHEFGDAAEIRLELWHDPEEYFPHLVLLVRLAPYPRDFQQRLDKVQGLLPDDTPGTLLFGSDFRKPGDPNRYGV
jgi:hypothetical protein